MSRLLAWVFIVVLASPSVFAEAGLRFLRHGREIGAWQRDQLSARVPAQTLSVWEPHDGSTATYVGFPARALFDRAYGPGWRTSDELLFTCLDGYQPSIPVERFLKYDGLLAYGRNDAAPFSLTNQEQGGETIDLGPYYLVWNNVKAPELRATRRPPTTP